jgi:hypothetical protein
LKLRIALLSLLALCSAVVPAVAQDIYDNGPTNGTTDAWTINFGFVVSDSFTVGSGGNVNHITFATWMAPGDTLMSAEVQIGTFAFGNDIFDQTVSFTQSGCVGNQYGFNVCTESSNMNVSLDAGTYWLTLQNASSSLGDPVYWDENSGPSSAEQNAVGTIPSESFTLGGETTVITTSTTTTSTTPEPSNIMLLGSGILGLAGVVRRKLRR